MDAADRLFHALDVESRGYITKQTFSQALLDRGILLTDVRVRASH